MLSIRPATADDALLLKTLIHELAKYEHLDHETIITEEDVSVSYTHLDVYKRQRRRTLGPHLADRTRKRCSRSKRDL